MREEVLLSPKPNQQEKSASFSPRPGPDPAGTDLEHVPIHPPLIRVDKELIPMFFSEPGCSKLIQASE